MFICFILFLHNTRKEIYKEVDQSNTDYIAKQTAWIEAFTLDNFTSNTEIVVNTMGVSPPRENMEETHSYPFHTMDTLAAWLDWEYDIQPMRYGNTTCYLHIFIGNGTRGWHEDCPDSSDNLFTVEDEINNAREINIQSGDTIFVQTDDLSWYVPTK